MALFASIFKRRKPLPAKLRLYSMRKSNDKTIFKVEKRQIFFKYFRKLLGELGFKDVETWHYDPALNKEFPIGQLVNFCDTFKNKNCEIDIVFTQDREVIILKSSETIRKKFMEELMKFCEWKESKRRIKPLEPIRTNF